jgi:hypothetical protein
MKKDNDLLEGHRDEEEDLFDLSLDDLEPEDTIVESHLEEPDDEIIELIDLVQKGDIDLGEEVKDPEATIFMDIQEPSDDELKVDETLDLLDIPLDEEISFDEFEEEVQVNETGETAEEGHELKFFVGDERSEVAAEAPLELFTELPSTGSAQEESFTDMIDPLEELPAIEIAPLIAEFEEEIKEQPSHEHEKTIRIFPEEKGAEPLFDLKIDGLEQLPGVASEVIQKEQEATLQQLSSKGEMPSPLPTEAVSINEEKIEAIVRKIIEETVPVIVEEKLAGAVEKIISGAKKDDTAIAEVISEEKIEAILRKVVEDTVPGIAEEKMSRAVEKIFEGSKREETPAVEAPVIIPEEKIELVLRKLVEDVVEKVARETMAGVAEKIITDAINALQKSIEPAS